MSNINAVLHTWNDVIEAVDHCVLEPEFELKVLVKDARELVNSLFALRAENERLRDSLGKFNSECAKWGDRQMTCYEISQEAKQALVGGEGKG